MKIEQGIQTLNRTGQRLQFGKESLGFSVWGTVIFVGRMKIIDWRKKNYNRLIFWNSRLFFFSNKNHFNLFYEAIYAFFKSGCFSDTPRLPTGEMTTSDLQRYISALGNLQKDNISRKNCRDYDGSFELSYKQISFTSMLILHDLKLTAKNAKLCWRENFLH